MNSPGSRKRGPRARSRFSGSRCSSWGVTRDDCRYVAEATMRRMSRFVDQPRAVFGVRCSKRERETAKVRRSRNDIEGLDAGVGFAFGPDDPRAEAVKAVFSVPSRFLSFA